MAETESAELDDQPTSSPLKLLPKCRDFLPLFLSCFLNPYLDSARLVLSFMWVWSTLNPHAAPSPQPTKRWLP